MKKILVLVLAVCMLMCLSACQQSEQNLKENLIGTWELSDGSYLTFYPDDTGKLETEHFTTDITYNVSGDTVTLNYNSNSDIAKSVKINTDSNPKTFTGMINGSQITMTYVEKTVR